MGKRRGMHPLIKAGIAAGALLLLVAALIAVWAVGVMQRQPTIKVDYVAKLNERARAVPPEERAWPVYARAHAALVPMEAIDPERRFAFADPDEEEWDKLVAWVEANEETLEILEEARDKDGMGFVADLNPRAHGPLSLPLEAYMKLSGSDVLSTARGLARLHRAAAVLAASRGDAEAVVSHVACVYNLATASNEMRLPISALSAHAIVGLGDSLVAAIISRYPDLFSKAQLSTLREIIRQTWNDTRRIDISGERYTAYDVIQRSYTDDGAGGGKFAPRVWTVDSNWLYGLTPLAATPFVLDRGEITAVIDEAFSAVEERNIQEPWTWEGPLDPGPLGSELRNPLPLHFMRFQLSEWFDVHEGFVTSFARSNMEGRFADLILAATQHRERHGAWPESMEAIDGDLLEEPTLDMFTGEPVKYGIRDGKPLIYSVGNDRDDDGGRYEGRPFTWVWPKDSESQEHDGDWVFFPPPQTN